MKTTPNSIAAAGVAHWTGTSRMWYVASTNTTETPIAIFPDGEWCARLDADCTHNGIDVLVQNNIYLKANHTYKLSFDMWGERPVTEPLDVRFTHSYTDSLIHTNGIGVTVIDEKTTIGNDGVSEEVAVSFTPAVTAMYAMQFFADNTPETDSGNHIWIDNVQITQLLAGTIILIQ